METKMLDNYVLNSKIKSKNVTNKEKWLGYLIGPNWSFIIKCCISLIFKCLLYGCFKTNICLGWIIFNAFSYNIKNY